MDVGRKRVVVAEDDAAVLRLIHTVLTPVADVTLAVDGLDAWNKLQTGPVPDLLVTDLMMPRLDGLSLVRRMRGDPRLSRVPVIMLTARDGPGDAITGINAGAQHYLNKPFKAPDLVDKVKAVLRLPK
jgi:CheY-like chemotaxis protein